MKHPYEEDERALVWALLTIPDIDLSSWEVRFVASIEELVLNLHSCMSVAQTEVARRIAKDHGLWEAARCEG